MKRLTVAIPRDVQEQILEQVLFIAQDSPGDALAWGDRVPATMNALGEVHGHAVDEDASRRIGMTVRKVVFEGTYLNHYRVDEAAGCVVVVNLRHGARLPHRGEP